MMLTVAVLAISSSSAATVEEIANYKGADRQAILEAGARKEGKLTFYAVGTQIEPLVQKFREKFPYIRAEMARQDDSTIVVRKLMEEYKAGLFQCDGLELSAASLIPLREEEILQPYSTPESVGYDQAAIETGRHWVSARESYGGISYNTKVIDPAGAPKTWQDLLNPQFKGKMALGDTPSTVGNWTGLMVTTYGADFMQKIGAQDIKLFNITNRALTNLNITGEVPIIARATDAQVNESKAKGAPLEWVDPGVVTVNDTSVAVSRKAPHPHAMMLLIDYLLSAEGQEGYAGLGYSSARKDRVNAVTPIKKVYLEQRPAYHQEFENWVDLFDKTVRRRR